MEEPFKVSNRKSTEENGNFKSAKRSKMGKLKKNYNQNLQYTYQTNSTLLWLDIVPKMIKKTGNFSKLTRAIKSLQ